MKLEIILDNRIKIAKELMASIEKEYRENSISISSPSTRENFFNSCDKRISLFWQSTNAILSKFSVDYTTDLIEWWNCYGTVDKSGITYNTPFNQFPDKINLMIGTLEAMKSMVIVNTDMNTNTNTNTNSKEKTPLLFISHASANKAFVNALVELLNFLKFDTSNMFCSSKPGYNIPVGEDIYGFLRSRFVDYDIFVVFVHSKEFYQSHACLNEMGAAWALQSKYASILLPGFEFKDMDGAVSDKEIAIKIDDKQAWSGMNSLKEKLVSVFKLPEPNHSAWEDARNSFFESVLDKH